MLSCSCIYLLSLQKLETVHRPPVPPALHPAACLACGGAASLPGSKGHTTAQSAAAGQLAACWWGAPQQTSLEAAAQRTPMLAVGRGQCPQCCPHHSPAAWGQQQQVRHDLMSLQERDQTAEASLTIKVVPVQVQQQQVWVQVQYDRSASERQVQVPHDATSTLGQSHLCIIKHGQFQAAKRQLLLHSWAAHNGQGSRILKDRTAARAKGCVVGLGEVLQGDADIRPCGWRPACQLQPSAALHNDLQAAPEGCSLASLDMLWHHSDCLQKQICGRAAAGFHPDVTCRWC